MKKAYAAFSLIEILVVIGLLLITVSFVMPMALSQVRGDRVLSDVRKATSLLFVTQQNAYAGKNSKSYGIKFESNSYTAFVGDSFATAESTETFPLTNGISESPTLSGGGDELVFLNSSFKPNKSGEILFSDGLKSYRILINSEGLIYFK